MQKTKALEIGGHAITAQSSILSWLDHCLKVLQETRRNLVVGEKTDWQVGGTIAVCAFPPQHSVALQICRLGGSFGATCAPLDA